jgi:protein gp37
MLKSKNNMYSFIDDRWNPIKGRCPFDCSYCYVKRWGNKQKPLRLDVKELQRNLGKDKFIFVCSGCDLFHPDVPWDWIAEVIVAARGYGAQNAFLWHTKNPARALEIPIWQFPPKSTLCATIESNVYTPDISKAPSPLDRAAALRKWKGERMIAVEPVMNFDLAEFADLIVSCNPGQVNIGADSGRNALPEPPSQKIETLIAALENAHIRVHLKDNLKRIYQQGGKP